MPTVQRLHSRTEERMESDDNHMIVMSEETSNPPRYNTWPSFERKSGNKTRERPE